MGLSAFASMAAGAALVAKEIKVNKTGPQYVHIVARKSGLLAFLLSAIGIDTTTKFDVYADRIEFNKGSLSGYVKTTMPLSSLSVITGGFVKPIFKLIIGLVMVVCGFCSIVGGLDSYDGGALIVTIGFMTLIIGLILIVYYFLSKTLLIQVAASSGWVAAILLKRSVIEGVAITPETADTIVDMVTQLTMAQTARNDHASGGTI